MIIAKNGSVKVSGYTFTLIKETMGIIDSLMESDVLGKDSKSKETMLNTMIKTVKCKSEGRDPMELIEYLSKDETRAFILLMKAFEHEEADGDEEEDDEDVTDSGSSESKPKVTVICNGKKVVTDADGIGKIIADMVADELKNDGKEKK